LRIAFGSSKLKPSPVGRGKHDYSTKVGLRKPPFLLSLSLPTLGAKHAGREGNAPRIAAAQEGNCP